MKTASYNGHTIQVDQQEQVIYDGKPVITRPNPLASGSYLFAANDGGETVEYELTIGSWGPSGTWVILKRNGKFVFAEN